MNRVRIHLGLRWCSTKFGSPNLMSDISVIYVVFTIVIMLFVGCTTLIAQVNTDSTPSVVRPGAPGQPTKVLPVSTRAKLPPVSAKDIEFMQGMIFHHAQAVEMTALMNERTNNQELRLLGARIKQSQSDEMNFMKRWLEARGEFVLMPVSGLPSSHSHQMQGSAGVKLMPGMLTQEQMKALAASKGTEFDRLFLRGMIQHHEGALEMVKELFDSAGAGQDAEIFNFATDVDSGQRAEIKIMSKMLGEDN